MKEFEEQKKEYDEKITKLIAEKEEIITKTETFSEK